jgi:hypothetical protein
MSVKMKIADKLRTRRNCLANERYDKDYSRLFDSRQKESVDDQIARENPELFQPVLDIRAVYN